MGKKTGVALLGVVFSVGVLGLGAELVRFESNARFSGGIYWLEDVRLHHRAIWEFSGVPQGLITLELEAFSPTDCKKARDNRVYLRLFYRDPRDAHWEATDIVLRYVGVEGGLARLRGEVSFVWEGGDRLTVMAVRTYACDPHIGVTETSLHFPARKPSAPPSPPPRQTPQTSPAATKPCYDISKVVCHFDGDVLNALYGIAVPQVPIEERTLLPETTSPWDAYVLDEGFYWGTIGKKTGRWGAVDAQDWYKIVVPLGKVAVIHIERLGAWEGQAFVYNACGYYREEVPLKKGHYCLLPRTERDKAYLIRVFRKSGVGEYLLTVLFVDICG